MNDEDPVMFLGRLVPRWYRDNILRDVAAAPPFSPETEAKLRVLLRPVAGTESLRPGRDKEQP